MNGRAVKLDGAPPETGRAPCTEAVCPARVCAMLAEKAESEVPEIIRTIIIRIP
jgi:hypothetical protein